MTVKTNVVAGFAMAMLLSGTNLSAAAPVGDATMGKAVFARCGICHTTEAGRNKIGPSLSGIVGRKSGSLTDFNYSTAMKGSHLVWTPAILDKYLTKPDASYSLRRATAGVPAGRHNRPARRDKVAERAHRVSSPPGTVPR